MKAKPHILALVLAIFGTSVGSRSLQAQQEVLEELRQVAIIDEKIMVPIRDGVRLATDVFRPRTGERVPIIFSRTPYNFNAWRDREMTTRTYQSALRAVRRGYAYVVQNERGKFFSGYCQVNRFEGLLSALST